MLAFVSDDICLQHNDNEPEVRERWRIFNRVVRDRKWKELTNATPFQIVDKAIAMAHSKGYIKMVEFNCQEQPDKDSEDSKKWLGYVCTKDVTVTPGSLLAAYAGVDSVLTAINAIVESKEPANFVYCNARPPNHHAGYNSTSGYCVFNGVAIGALYAINTFPNRFQHVAIVDMLDIHANDGTLSVYLKHEKAIDGRISLYSIHQSGIFPDTEYSNATEDYSSHVHNKALPGGVTLDDYLVTFLEMKAKLVAHKPDLIIISCGFDSCIYETMGQFPILPSTYEYLTKELIDVCPNVVSMQEGGYILETIGECLNYHLKGAEKAIQL